MGLGSALCFVAFIAIVLMEVAGHPGFRDLFPNGHVVPDPCSGIPGDTWHRVGHLIKRKEDDVAKKQYNNFGKDFLEKKNRVGMGAEEIWPDLCKLDSDGDGRTNGVELGDPNCLWYFGEPSPANMTIYHPGIPENANGTLTEQTRASFCNLPLVTNATSTTTAATP